MTKTLFFALTILLCTTSSRGQQPLPAGFGEGVISFRSYFLWKMDTASSGQSELDKQTSYSTGTYYIKGSWILRKDPQDSMTTASGADSVSRTEVDRNSGSSIHTMLKTTMVHPVYLIDWQQKTGYTYYRSKGQLFISQTSLADLQAEIFYRVMLAGGSTIRTLSRTDSLLVNEKRCYKGIATDKMGQAFVFYYSTDRTQVHSPLNGFLPADFPYEVLYIRVGTNATSLEGNAMKASLVFVVSSVNSVPLPDDLFCLPKEVPVLKNVPWSEMYKPEL